MAARLPVDRPSWTRRVPGWSFLLVFVSLIVLTYFAVYYYNRNDLIMAGYLAALASTVPFLFLALPYYVFPVWGLAVPLSVDAVARALAAATEGRHAEPLEDRDGPFAQCAAVVRFDDPGCTVGWFSMPAPPRSAAASAGSTLVLRAGLRDRKALAAFREALARALLEAERSRA